MLGIKLTLESETRLKRFVQRRGQRLSDVGRAAIDEYLDRHDDDGEFARQVARVAAFERSDTAASAELEELEDMAWAMSRDVD